MLLSRWRVGVICVPAFAVWLGLRSGLLRGGDDEEEAREGGVPAVDLSLLTGPSRPAAVAALAAAARDSGVVRLRGHGAGVAAARRSGWAYFALPQELKECPSCSVRNASVGFQRGYIPFASESGLASVLEVKEGFSYGFEWPANATSEHPFQASNVWPAEEGLAALGPSWRGSMLGFFDETVAISAAAVEALAEALGDAGKDLPELCRGGETISQMRMFHYLPPTAKCDKRCMGSSPHTDWHFVTIISRDAASSLQYVDRRTGEWVDATSSEDELLLLVGDWLAAYSGGEFHAPAHRVLSPEKESSLSFVLFFYPSVGARLPGSRGGRAPGGASAGEEVNTVEASMFDLAWGDYVVQKWAKVMSNR